MDCAPVSKTPVINQPRSLTRKEYERRTPLPHHSRRASRTDASRAMADRLLAQIEQANAHVERPGGMNYLLPPPVPKEIIASILFSAIAAANHGCVKAQAGFFVSRQASIRFKMDKFHSESSSRSVSRIPDGCEDRCGYATNRRGQRQNRTGANKILSPAHNAGNTPPRGANDTTT